MRCVPAECGAYVFTCGTYLAGCKSGPNSAARMTENDGGLGQQSGAWIATRAGAHLRGRSTANTAPEVALRKALHRRGLRFRLDRRIGRYRRDLVLPRYRVALFVDGCYWHGCPTHGIKVFRGPNADRWRRKIAANQSRDSAANEIIGAQGWRVIRLWECEIEVDADLAAEKVMAFVETVM